MEYNEANLLELYKQGLSYSQIAKKLNVTRSVVSGKLQRLKKKDARIAAERVKQPEVVKEVKQKPNKYTFKTRPTNYREMSKADLQSMLKQAVENTK